MRYVILLLLLACAPAFGADGLVAFETRPGVKLSYWLMERPGAPLTVALLAGGGGGIGLRDGVPQSKNFLIRARDHFAAAGFNVVLVGRSSDRSEWDASYRQTDEHVTDLRIMVEKLRRDLKVPVWLVGTSNGTFSAAAAGIGLDPKLLAGIVLTSTVTDGYGKFNPVPGMALEKIRVPVLVMHHKQDACRYCWPRSVDGVMSGLRNAPVKKKVMVDGGGPPTGEPCEALHWHGFIGMEKEAVDTVTAWIRNPAP